MAWVMGAIAIGSTVVSGYSQYQSQQDAADQQNEAMAHQMQVDATNDLLAEREGSRRQAQITRNIRRNFSNAVSQMLDVDTAAAVAKSKARVQANASGTAGGSVDAQLMQIDRNASMAESQILLAARDTAEEFERARIEVEYDVLGKQNNNIYQPATAPNAALSALSTGLNAATSYYYMTNV